MDILGAYDYGIDVLSLFEFNCIMNWQDYNRCFGVSDCSTDR